jgi:hypothetical protein
MAIPGSLIDIFLSLRRMVEIKSPALVQAEEGQNGHDHDDQADQIDDPVHVASPLLPPECRMNANGTNTFRQGRAVGSWTMQIVLHRKSP